jgi:hypothetical protein
LNSFLTQQYWNLVFVTNDEYINIYFITDDEPVKSFGKRVIDYKARIQLYVKH